MDIKLVIFDLDGVLVDTKDVHFNTLNDAIEYVAGKQYCITVEEHLHTYDGLKTNQKLELLTKYKLLDSKYHKDIWQRKQEATLVKFKNIITNNELIKIFNFLKKENVSIACCSNSIKRTVLLALSKLDIIEYFSIIISNEDVKYSKPYPEMFWKAMAQAGSLPEETLIIEDSPPGLLGASRTRANILRVKDSKDLTYEKFIIKYKQNKNMQQIPKWQDEKLNVLIPMAGAGSRFQQAGYTFPKPLIDVKGCPMIQTVVNNLNIDANFIFVVQKDHRIKYNLDSVLGLIAPNCKIVETDGLTEGAACTVLLAKKYIDNDNPLVLANSDQFIEWNSNEFMYKMYEQSLDGGILTFNSTHPKWSYAKINDNGFVVEVAEKNPISNMATTGIYFWKKGSDFVKYAESMINKNTRVNNEFYVCPVFNEAILDNKKIKTFNIEKMWGIGTPEDLNTFLESYKEI
jgi:HAD superfamily hydrolase (TIGR01509 family)